MTPEDKNIQYILEAAGSLEFALWQEMGVICNSHTKYVNSGSKQMRMEYLSLMRNGCISMARKIRGFFGDRPIRARDVRSIAPAVRPTLSSHFLNLTQLYQTFVHVKRNELKFHYLTSMYYLLNDMTEVILEENCEPEKLLEPIGD
jgi:hypothetical protein